MFDSQNSLPVVFWTWRDTARTTTGYIPEGWTDCRTAISKSKTRKQHLQKQLLQPKREGEHQLYARLRDWHDQHSAERRDFFHALWSEFEPFAPTGFAKKLQIEFHQRWWEMYLVVALLNLGLKPKTNTSDSGPDVVLEVGGQYVFLEATAPSAGHSSDRVPEPVHNGVADFPERECLLRLTQALIDKKERLRTYIDKGVIPENACNIIALSASDLNQFGTLLDGVHPAPLSVLAGAGPTVVTIGGKKPPFSSRRNALVRDSGSHVDAVLFERPDFSILSGVLYSPVDLWNAMLTPGDSLSLFVNPHARTHIPSDFQKLFVRWTRDMQTGDEIVWKKTPPSSGLVC